MPWSIPWPSLHEFHSIVTHPRCIGRRRRRRALDQIDAWLEAPSLVLLARNVETLASLRE